MVDLISNNKQIFQQTRRAVREDIVDTSDFKIDKTGRKYKAHRIKLGDNPAVADGTVELAKEVVMLRSNISLQEVRISKLETMLINFTGSK